MGLTNHTRVSISIIGRNTGAVSGKSVVRVHRLAHPLRQGHEENPGLLAVGGKERHAEFSLAKVESLEGKNPQ